MLTYEYTLVQVHRQLQTHMHACTQIDRYTHTYRYIESTDAHIHMRDTDRDTHTHTHTHTHDTGT